MTESTLVITRSRTQTIEVGDFQFSPDFSEPANFLLAYRMKAWEIFKKLPFPSETDEAWKRTSIKELRFEKFRLLDPSSKVETNIPESLTKPLADDIHGGQILLSPGRATITLDSDLAALGVIFTDLEHAQKEYPEFLAKAVEKTSSEAEDKFTALARALGTCGILLYIPKGVKVEKPLHTLFWAFGEGLVHASKIFVYLEEDASVTYVHESSSPNNLDGQSIHTGIMEVYAGPGSKLNFVELQSFGSNIWNFTHERVSVDRDAEVDWIFGALGSHVTKNFSDLNLIGQGSSGKMSGFYFTNQDQHLDHDTQQNHLAPNTTSDLLFKGALLGKSRSVWQGMIYVAPNADKTNGYQANRNLVLSEKARADSIPGLEILTDDVRCTHGATVGKIDIEQVFYLESRGMPRKTAEKLIVEGFFDPIMQRIPFNGVRNRFQSAIEEKMNGY
ncbi:MAG: Fe-S cluster assembly protein SufD [Chloroflexi bacterium]|nr:MAG: Fe-S cluster assembly protein SufD [Chloroflexota bacterium]MBA4374996.1 Fe-S cluster assembly protein SufD [Anaerolinea sp.]